MNSFDETLESGVPFGVLSSLVQEYIEGVYGIPVVTRDIPDPLTGDLNGSEIHIDYQVTPDQRLFLLAHLFGHTVQWNVDPRAFEIGKPQIPPVPESLIPELMEYEREAGCYGLTLLYQADVHLVDQWYCDYTACDRAYLFNYYRTGDKKNPLTFWQDGTPRLEPKAIPEFTPVRRVFRIDGIVI